MSDPTHRPTRKPARAPSTPRLESPTATITRRVRELEARLAREVAERDADAAQIGELLAVLADRERQIASLKVELERRDQALAGAEQRFTETIAKAVVRVRGEQVEATVLAAQTLVETARALAESTDARLVEARAAAERIGVDDPESVVEAGLRAVAGTVLAIEPVEAAIRRANVQAAALRAAERQADEARERLPDLLTSLARTTERLRAVVGRLAATPLKSNAGSLPEPPPKRR